MRYALVKDGVVDNVIEVDAILTKEEVDAWNAEVASVRSQNEAMQEQWRSTVSALRSEWRAAADAIELRHAEWRAAVTALEEGDTPPPEPDRTLPPEPALPNEPTNLPMPAPLVGFLPPPDHQLIASDEAGLGWTYDGQAFHPPAGMASLPPAPLPDISDRQFFQALATAPYSAVTGVTMAEAKLAVKIGQLPASIQSIIDAIEDEDERDRADMLLAGATVFDRAHPEVGRFATALGWTGAQVDEFWRFAASL